MITSIYKELYEVHVPSHEGQIKMLPFDLGNLAEVPEKFKAIVTKMVEFLPIKSGKAYLTVDGKLVEKGKTQRRGGKHIDGNYLTHICGWGSGGGNGWKVGEGGQKINSKEHNLSYNSETGGMLIVSNYPSCKAWYGVFEGEAKEGGDCSHLKETNEGFILKPNIVYYGNSQFLHESLPIDKTVHRTLVRITLPSDYPVVN